MRGSRLYMILLFAFIVLVFIFEYMSPHKFSWNPTYDKNDKEPFGCYVFDDIMSSSIDNYSVVDKTFYQIFSEDSTITQHSFLLVENYLPFSETDIEYLYKLIHLGNRVMICSDSYPHILRDTLKFEISYDGYYRSYRFFINEAKLRDSIFFGTDTLNPERIFEVYPQLHPVSLIAGMTRWDYVPDSTENEIPVDYDSLIIDEEFYDNEDISDMQDDNYSSNDENLEIDKMLDSVKDESYKTSHISTFIPINCDSAEVLVWNNNNEPLVIRTFIGKGEILLVSTPLMFTNYGMLDGNNASYAFRLLSYMKDMPLIRIEAYGNHGSNKNTPLRYILSEPPLRWAIYFAMVLLISFMFFATKRRQRVIPVVNAPPNRSIEFMQLISNLYYQKHNNLEILKMKHNYFCIEVKSFIGIDLRENIPTESDFLRLVEKTGLEKYFISNLLKNIQMSFYRSEVSDIELKQYIDGMNEILKELKIKN